jgi:tetratricopeptide (TPR) repeat protein
MAFNANDPHAPYYLGNFWYSRKQYDDAIAAWERARDLNPDFPTVQRNLGLAYMNKRGDVLKAQAAYKRAFALDETDARVFFELDQLRKRARDAQRRPPGPAGTYDTLVQQRDDLTIEKITLLNLTGQHEKALSILLAHRFHPWEGAKAKPPGSMNCLGLNVRGLRWNAATMPRRSIICNRPAPILRTWVRAS